MSMLSKLFKSQEDKIPELTQEVVESVLHESYKNMVVYDIDTGKMNRRLYNGLNLICIGSVGAMMPRFKWMCEQSSVLAHRAPVAIAAKTVPAPSSTQYHNHGKYVMGNVVFWDKKKKEYSALNRWMLCNEHWCHIAAAEQSLIDVAEYVTNRIHYLETCVKEKSK